MNISYLSARAVKILLAIINMREVFKIKGIEQHNERKGGVCVVLGNGPSLEGTVKDDLIYLSKNTLICVNDFAVTELYEQLRPKYYVLADPVYFEKESLFDGVDSGIGVEKIKQEYANRLDKIRSELFANLEIKTVWELRLFLPVHIKGNLLFDDLVNKNKNIKLQYFSPIPIDFQLVSLRNILYKWGVGMPRPQTVLISAIFIAVMLRFKKILVVGADHSWHEDLVLDEDNTLGTYDQHFYDTSKNERRFIPLVKNADEGITTTVAEQFYALYLAFRSHMYLKQFADSMGSEIINCSKKTWIDAYKRKACLS